MTATAPGTIRAFVAGWPVDHSLSPVMHGHWLQRHGIDGSYEALPVPPEEIAGFLSGLPQSAWAGGNVTLPHKEAAFNACDRLDDAARAIGAVNTVWVEAGTLAGANTDAYGFLANLDDRVPGWSEALQQRMPAALVLGAGGASRAIVHALASRGVGDIVITNRTKARAEALAAHFGRACRAAAWEDIGDEIGRSGLIVNTTSLGMKGQPPLGIDLSKAGAGTVVTDIVYTPLETPLLAQARALGLETVDGLGMLLHQAVPGFEKWFGRRPRVDDALRDAVLAALEGRR